MSRGRFQIRTRFARWPIAFLIAVAAVCIPVTLSTTTASASRLHGLGTYAGTIGDTGCGYSVVVLVDTDAVNVHLTNASDCGGVSLSGEVSGNFDGSSTDDPGTKTPTEPGTSVTINYLSSASATVLGHRLSLASKTLNLSFNLGVNLEQAHENLPAVQKSMQSASGTLATDAELYLSQGVANSAAGGSTGLDFDAPFDALQNAEGTFCATFAGDQGPVKGKPVGTYPNCAPPLCPPGGAAGNACTFVASDSASIGGTSESSQDQLCPATPPNEQFLFVCVPTFVGSSYSFGKQSVVLLPGGALIAGPIGSKLGNLLAGPIVSSNAAIVSLGGVIAGDNLTLKAPEVEMAAGVVTVIGNLTISAGTSAAFGSIDAADLPGLVSSLTSALKAIQQWVSIASAAGVNDKALAGLVPSASIALPLEVTAKTITVTTKRFALGSSSEFTTRGLGSSTGLNEKLAQSGNSSGYFGASHGGYGGITGTSGDTGAYWNTMSTRTPTYDDPFAPTQPGTGQPAMPGGGVVRIDAHAGSAEIDGTIDADGFWEPDNPDYSYGCSQSCGLGAGGSVFITAGSLSGDGTVSANGASLCPFEDPCDGQLYDGCGGGGRIAAIFGSDAGWTGTLEAYGGWERLTSKDLGIVYPNGTGGAGTVFTQQVQFNKSGGVSSGVGAFPDGTLTIDGGQSNGWYPPPEFYPPPDATPVLAAWSDPKRKLVITGEALVWATSLDYGEIDVLDDSMLTTPPGQMTLTITSPMLTIDATSQVTVATRGYAGDGKQDGRGGTAKGATTSGPGSGGSHGGRGGNNQTLNANTTVSGSTYDSVQDPQLPGGGGGAGASGPGSYSNPGGGVLNLQVGTLHLDGLLSANGQDSEGPTAVDQAVYDNSAGGGGAGGSILLHLTQLSGSGTISADGGLACETGGAPLTPTIRAPQGCNAPSGGVGAGGGGRIAVYAGAECSWTGAIGASGAIDQVSVKSGYKNANGEPGSVYVDAGSGSC